MMNNYFHDVATALLITSAFVMITLSRTAERQGHIEAVRYFVDVYPRLTLLARIALGWIWIGGTVRLFTYMDFEFANAVGKDQVPALIVKHLVMFSFVGAGGYLWLRLSRRVKELRRLVEESDNSRVAQGVDTPV